jgi:WD40 repeat protein/serine/threonine protein kinase
MSDSSSSAADPFGQIADEFVEAFRQGKRPSVEEFAQRYPEHAEEIREMLPALVLMEQAKSAGHATGEEGKVAAPTAVPTLRQLGDYRILREVGRGGMGVVYEAQQLSLGRHVAIKVLPSHALLDPRQLGRFQREARSAAKLHHTNIVPVFGVGEQDGLHYYVMQFIAGLGLDVVVDELRRLRQSGGKQPLTQADAPGRPTNRSQNASAVAVARGLLSGVFRQPEQTGDLTTAPGEASPVASAPGDLAGSAQVGAADTSGTVRLPGQSRGSTLSETGSQYWQSVARVGMQVADALAHASSQGVLHRDIKPSNLLLDDTGNVWVTDFGLAKAQSDSDNLTHTGDIVGTLRYMAPERFNGQGDLRSDIYSLGLTLYEMLTLRPAFDETDRNKLVRQVMHDEPPRPRQLNARVPRDLETVVLKAIARDPAHRYQTPADMADDLKRFLEDRPVKARRISNAERLWRWCRRNPLVSGLAATVVLALVAGATVSYLKYREAESARAAEAARVTERDEALGERNLALSQANNALARESAQVKERDDALEKRDAALGEAKNALARESQRGVERDQANDKLKHRLGVSSMILAGAAYDNRDLKLAAERLDSVPEAQRGWDWHYLKHQTRGGIFTLYGHAGPVTCAAYSPDGTRIVTAGGNGNYPFEVKMWDARTGTFLLDLKGPPPYGEGILFPVGQRPGGPLGRVERQEDIWPRVAFSPDGTRLVTCGVENTVRVWDARTGSLLRELKGHTDKVSWATFSPDSTRIVTGSGDRTAKVWDARTGAPVVELKGHRNPVMRASYSPDGSRIVTAGFQGGLQRGAELKVWDARTGEFLRDAEGIMTPDGSVAFSPDSKRIVVGRDDGKATVIDAQTAAVLVELRGRPRVAHQFSGMAGMVSVAFSPDGTRIATGGSTGGFLTGEASVWDARTGQELLELKGHRDLVMSVAFSPDGMQIVTGSRDKTAKVWDARTGTPRLEFAVTSVALDVVGRTVAQPSCVAWSADGTRLVTGGNKPTVWDARTGTALVELKGLKDIVRGVAFSKDGARVVTGGGAFDFRGPLSVRANATVWDARTGAPLLELKGLKEPVHRVAFSPDGTRIVTTGLHRSQLGGAELKVWDATTGTLLLDLTHQDPTRNGWRIGEGGGCVAFSPDGTRFVTGAVRAKSFASELKVWDARTGRVLVQMKENQSPVISVAFSADGTQIVTASSTRTTIRSLFEGGKTATVWDAQTGTALRELEGHTGEVSCAAFSPDRDGTRIVTGSGDRTVRVWDARTGTSLIELKGHTGGVNSVAFSPDGTRIVSAGSGDSDKPGEVFVWDARMRTPEVELVGHTGPIFIAVFSPDSTRIATSGQDKMVKVWDARKGTTLVELKGHTSEIESVAFRHDGTRIVTSSLDQTVRVWDARTGTELARLETGTRSAAFSLDGTRIVTEGYDKNTNVWDAQTGQELKGEAIPKTVPSGQTSPDGRLFAHLNQDRADVVPLVPDAEELAYRRLHTQPNLSRYRASYLAARAAKDDFAAAFYLNLIPPDERKQADAEALAALSRHAEQHLLTGNPDLALPLLVEIAKVKKVKLGPEDPETLAALDKLGDAHSRMGQVDKAIPVFEEIVKVREAKFGRDDRETLNAMGKLGGFYKVAGRLKEAIPLLEAAYRAAKGDPQLAWGRANELMDAYRQAGEFDKVAVVLLELLPEVRKQYPKDSPQLAGVLAAAGGSLLEKNKWVEAEPLLREALAIREKTQPEDWSTFNAQSMLGGSLLGQKKYADAEPLLLKGYKGMKQRAQTIPRFGGGELRIPQAIDRLIELYTAMNKPDEAKKWRAEGARYRETLPLPQEKK